MKYYVIIVYSYSLTTKWARFLAEYIEHAHMYMSLRFLRVFPVAPYAH